MVFDHTKVDVGTVYAAAYGAAFAACIARQALAQGERLDSVAANKEVALAAHQEATSVALSALAEWIDTAEPPHPA